MISLLVAYLSIKSTGTEIGLHSLNGGLYASTVTINRAHKALLIVDSGSINSFITPDAAKRIGHVNPIKTMDCEVEFAGKTVKAKIGIFDRNLQTGYDGILGRDILGNCVIGIDFVNSKLTVWRADISESQSRAWLLTSTGQSPFNAPTANRMDLKRGEYGRLVPAGNGIPEYEIDTGSSFNSISKNASNKFDHFIRKSRIEGLHGIRESDLWLSKRINGTSIELAVYNVFDEEDKKIYSGNHPEGVLSVNEYLSPKIILDFRSYRLMWLEGARIEVLAWRFSQILGIPMSIKQKELRLMHTSQPAYAGLQGFADCKVLVIGDYTGTEILDGFTRFDDQSMHLFASLIKRRQSPVPVIVEKDGRPLSLNITPLK